MKRRSIFIVESVYSPYFRIVLFLSLLVPLFGFNQNSDTLELEVINITPRYSKTLNHTNLRNADSIIVNAIPSVNLGQLLQYENSVQIKSYGSSGSSSSSIRGGNSSQTAVLWNGLNIRNPMLGENDFSTISSFLLDDIQIQMGGSTATWGNASVAGAIHLKTFSEFKDCIDLSAFAGAGSFGNYSSGAKINLGNKKYSSSTKFLLQKSDNNFKYLDANGKVIKMSNSALALFGFIHDSRFKINEKNILNFSYWNQQTERQISPTTNQQISVANQSDANNRFMVTWQHKRGSFNSFLKNGFFFDKLNYNDSLKSINNNSKAITHISELELNYTFSNEDMFSFGINNTYCLANSDAYTKNAEQNYFSIFGNYLKKSFSGNNSTLISIRQEHTLGKFQPFTYSISNRYEIKKWLVLKLIYNKLYRLPTFNNLYWNPGGNPSLLPENGSSRDFQIETKTRVFSMNQIKFQANSNIGFFTRNINNWIIWLPAANGVWSPQNILNVWSRGIETISSINLSAGKIKYKILLQTNYVLSTNEKSQLQNDNSLGRQLIYTPLYSGSLAFQIHASRFYFSTIHSYTGYRYITSDNLNYLTPFNLTNIFIGLKFSLSKYILDVNFSCNNIFNTKYEIIAQRPMPLLNYHLNLKISYSQKNNKPNN